MTSKCFISVPLCHHLHFGTLTFFSHISLIYLFFYFTSMTFLFYHTASRGNCQEIRGSKDDIQPQYRCYISCNTAIKSVCFSVPNHKNYNCRLSEVLKHIICYSWSLFMGKEIMDFIHPNQAMDAVRTMFA